MSDSFNVGRLNGPSGVPGESGELTPEVLTQQAALARLAEGGGTPAAPAASPAGVADGLSFSHEVGDAAHAGGVASGLFAAWGSPAPASDDGLVGGFQMQKSPPVGFQSGGVFSTSGQSGLEPGMQSGAVYATPPLRY
jgi:hypothetical protein